MSRFGTAEREHPPKFQESSFIFTYKPHLNYISRGLLRKKVLSCTFGDGQTGLTIEETIPQALEHIRRHPLLIKADNIHTLQLGNTPLRAMSINGGFRFVDKGQPAAIFPGDRILLGKLPKQLADPRVLYLDIPDDHQLADEHLAIVALQDVSGELYLVMEGLNDQNDTILTSSIEGTSDAISIKDADKISLPKTSHSIAEFNIQQGVFGIGDRGVRIFLQELPFFNFNRPLTDINVELERIYEHANKQIGVREDQTDMSLTAGIIQGNKLHMVSRGKISGFLYIPSIDKLVRITLPNHNFLREHIQSSFPNRTTYADFIFSLVMDVLDEETNGTDIANKAQNILNKAGIKEQFPWGDILNDLKNTSSIHAQPSASIDYGYIAVQPGDTIILSTNGGNGNITNEQIKEIVKNPNLTAEQKVYLLAKKTLNADVPPDNIAFFVATLG